MATAAGTIAAPTTESVVWSWITTVDHKRIGALYGVSAFIFFLIGGIEALLIRTQLAVPNGTVINGTQICPPFKSMPFRPGDTVRLGGIELTVSA